MLDAFLRLPDAAHVPTPTPALDAQACVRMVTKVERVSPRMRWLEQNPAAQPHATMHLPLRGSVHLRGYGAGELICVPGQLVLDRRPRVGAHQNRPRGELFRNCWAIFEGTALLAAIDAAVAAHGPVIDLRQRPEVWTLVHDWFAAALRSRRLDSATLGGMAFVWLARLVAPSGPSGLAAALALIESRIEDPDLDVAHLAKAAGCAESTFSRRFRAATGKAPYRFLLERRLDRAREQLFGGDPIAVIARRCGYRDAAHFIHSFRAAVGDSPDRYRRKLIP
jgi:AraC-like DNA-binding protein